jgi:hypothetical protein
VAKAKVSKAAYRKASTQRIELGDGQVQLVHRAWFIFDGFWVTDGHAEAAGG